jgi:DNA polymerase delta subunit 2
VQDIDRYSKVCDPMEGLRKTLTWSHIAPTCPDTLACYPFYEKDPFIIEECPHVYFAGNMPKFETELFEGNGKFTFPLVFYGFFSFCTQVRLGRKLV